MKHEDNRVFCNDCKQPMSEGYVINELVDYCEDCLFNNIAPNDYAVMYEEGNAYWTEFDNEDEIAIGR